MQSSRAKKERNQSEVSEKTKVQFEARKKKTKTRSNGKEMPFFCYREKSMK